MTQTFWPFPKGSAGSQVLEPQWSLTARNWLATGVIQGFLNQLAVTATGTAMQVNIDTGAANIMGFWLKNDASVAMQIAAADPTNPRIDVIAIRADWVANTVAFVVLKGTPAQTPVAPALTQTDILITPATARWEIALANVNVPAGVTTIAAANVTDKRTFSAGPTSTPTPGATAQYDQSSNFAANALMAKGITGATAGARLAGGTASGAPTTGTFQVGDEVTDHTGTKWICTVSGTPGTWQSLVSALSSGNKVQSANVSTTTPATVGNAIKVGTFSFPKLFKTGTVPIVLVSMVSGVGIATAIEAYNATNTGFDLYVNSTTASQPFTFNYRADGQ